MYYTLHIFTSHCVRSLFHIKFDLRGTCACQTVLGDYSYGGNYIHIRQPLVSSVLSIVAADLRNHMLCYRLSE